MFKLFLTASFLLMLLSAKLNAQYEFVDKLTNMVGDWHAVYLNSQGDTCVEDMNIQFKHSKMFIEMNITGYVAIKPVLKYSETIFLTADENGNIAGFYADDNGYNGMMRIKGKYENEVFKLNGDCKLWSEKSTLDYKEGKIIIKGTGKIKSTGEKTFATRIFERKS